MRYYMNRPVNKSKEYDAMNIYLSENIKRLRREKELTQEALAEFLGVTFQSVSNWERGESYPDITLLPEIAEFFKVSVDELLGVNKAENEHEINSKIAEYDNLTDHKLMQEIINDLKAKFPNDFRVLIRYLRCLVNFSEDLSAVSSEVFTIYNNIQQNCTDDRIRIKAKRAMIEFYRSQLNSENADVMFEKCEKIISEMPDMRDSREMFCTFYPEEHPEHDTKIQNAIEENFLLRTTFYSHYFFYNENCTDEWQTKSIKNEIGYLEFFYDDGNYGKMWKTMINLYGQLGVNHFKLNDYKNAINNFKKSAELAIKFDSLDRITTMHSTMFDGKEFDKHTLGSTFVAKNRVKKLLTKEYPLTDKFKETNEFKEIIQILN